MAMQYGSLQYNRFLNQDLASVLLGIIQTLKMTCTWHKKLEDNGQIIEWTAVFLKLGTFSTGWYLYHQAIKLFPDFLHCDHGARLEPTAPLSSQSPRHLLKEQRGSDVWTQTNQNNRFRRKLLAAYEANISLSVWRPFCHQSIFH